MRTYYDGSKIAHEHTMIPTPPKVHLAVSYQGQSCLPRPLRRRPPRPPVATPVQAPGQIRLPDRPATRLPRPPLRRNQTQSPPAPMSKPRSKRNKPAENSRRHEIGMGFLETRRGCPLSGQKFPRKGVN